MAKKTPSVDEQLRERLRELGAIGGKASAKKLSAPQRKQKAAAAAKARWGKKAK